MYQKETIDKNPSMSKRKRQAAAVVCLFVTECFFLVSVNRLWCDEQ